MLINEFAYITTGKPEGFFAIILTIITPFLTIASLVFFGLLLLLSLVHCYSESWANHQKISFRIFAESIWLVIIAILSIGYPKWPHTILARISSLATLLLGITFTVLFSAAVTTAMTISSSDLTLDNHNKLESLAGKKVAAISGSYAADILRKLNVVIVPVKNFEGGIALVRNHQVFGFIENYLTTQNVWNERFQDVRYSKFPLGKNEIAFAFPPHSSFVKELDVNLTLLQEANDIYPICAKYLTDESAKSCII